jgi:hypothetical protein
MHGAAERLQGASRTQTQEPLMAFYTVRLQGVPVAVLRGDTLEDATDLACDSHQTDALECHLLWDDNVPPSLVPATLAEIGMWAASFEAAVVRGGVDPEHLFCWMLLFGEDDESMRVYLEAPAATSLLH